MGRSQKKLDAQAEEMKEKHGVKAVTIAADHSSPDAAQKIYDACHANGWEPDAIINNAAFGGQGDFVRERTMEGHASGALPAASASSGLWSSTCMRGKARSRSR